MLDKLVTITTSIQAASDRLSLCQALEDGCRSIGFDLFSLSCHVNRAQQGAPLASVCEKCHHDYERFNWFADAGVTARVLAPEAPFFWDGRQGADEHSGSSLILPLAGRFGGLSVMSLVSTRYQAFGHEHVAAATIMANAALSKLEMLGLCSEIAAVDANAAVALQALSALQMEILKWIAEGKSNRDIATIMDITERLARYHVGEILRKLDVATRSQAARLLQAAQGAAGGASGIAVPEGVIAASG